MSDWVVTRSKNFTEKKFVVKFKTHILYSINILRNSVFYETMCKTDNTAKQATDCNTVRHRNKALCMLDNWGYRHKHSLCNNCWFSTPTMVKRTLSVISYSAVRVLFNVNSAGEKFRFYGTHIRWAKTNVLSSMCRYAGHSQIISTILCRILTLNFTQILQSLCKLAKQIQFIQLCKLYISHFAGFPDTHSHLSIFLDVNFVDFWSKSDEKCKWMVQSFPSSVIKSVFHCPVFRKLATA